MTGGVEPARPLCFVLMPFGTKTDPVSRLTVDFDDVYDRVIRPAIDAAELEPIRADEEEIGGIIHKSMYERLILCRYAVADLTTANANVYYELGIRHAFRPWSTVLIFADGARLPFDLAPLRGLPYQLDEAGALADPDADRRALAERLQAAREEARDSPIFQLWRELPEPDVSRLDADAFHDRMERAARLRERLAEAQDQGVEAIRQVRTRLGKLGDEEPGVLLDLMVAFRDAEQFDDMIDVIEGMPKGLAGTVPVREQYALALNRAGQGKQAERVLLELIEDRGPSSETYGILGRVYKDRWEAARTRGDPVETRGLLKKAIDAYVAGFETDWRDHYPGINAVQLMELRDPPDPRRRELLPVVTYSVKRRLAATRPDYWDHATLLELAVLGGDEEQAMDALEDAVAVVRTPFQPNSTLGTLRRLREAREARGEPVPAWNLAVERALEASAASFGRAGA